MKSVLVDFLVGAGIKVNKPYLSTLIFDLNMWPNVYYSQIHVAAYTSIYEHVEGMWWVALSMGCSNRVLVLSFSPHPLWATTISETTTEWTFPRPKLSDPRKSPRVTSWMTWCRATPFCTAQESTRITLSSSRYGWTRRLILCITQYPLGVLSLCRQKTR